MLEHMTQNPEIKESNPVACAINICDCNLQSSVTLQFGA
jgi:hypothetical protein